MSPAEDGSPAEDVSPAEDGSPAADRTDPAAFGEAVLGRSGVRVTRLGAGLAPVGGLYSPIGDAQAMATMDSAWEHGLRFFDTAPLYGYGHSERRAGTALAGRPRDGYALATKVGRLIVDRPPGDAADPPGGAGGAADMWAGTPAGVGAVFDFSAEGVRRSLAQSLARLGLDRVDVLHLHDPDDHLEQALAEAYPVLAGLRADGVVRAIGAGANSAETLAHLVRETGVRGTGGGPAGGGLDCVLLAGRYTLLDQAGLADLLPLCRQTGTAVIAAGVFNSGVLADPRPGATFNYLPAPPDLVARAREIGRICQRYGVPLRAAAVQFPLAHPAVVSVLVGVRSPAEVEEAVAAFRHPVPPDLWDELRRTGLIPAEAPVPA